MKCQSPCVTCQDFDPTKCTSCITGKYLKYGAPDCVDSEDCTGDRFGNPLTGRCDLCHPACSTCTGGSIDKCTECRAPYFLNEETNTCVLQCPDRFYNEPDGGGTGRRICAECSVECATCSGTASTCLVIANSPFSITSLEPQKTSAFYQFINFFG